VGLPSTTTTGRWRERGRISVRQVPLSKPIDESVSAGVSVRNGLGMEGSDDPAERDSIRL